MSNDPNEITKKEILETFTPSEFLRYRNGDRDLTTLEKEIINELSDMNLSQGVINVILDYVLITKDNSLPKNYILTIAVNLKNKNILTATDAMEHFKQRIKNKITKNDIPYKEVSQFLSKYGLIKSNATFKELDERLKELKTLLDLKINIVKDLKTQK